MLKPNIIDGQQRERILEKFDALLQREFILRKELSETDRIEFDHEVLRAYGIENNIMILKFITLHAKNETRSSLIHKK